MLNTWLYATEVSLYYSLIFSHYFKLFLSGNSYFFLAYQSGFFDERFFMTNISYRVPEITKAEYEADKTMERKPIFNQYDGTREEIIIDKNQMPSISIAQPEEVLEVLEEREFKISGNNDAKRSQHVHSNDSFFEGRNELTTDHRIAGIVDNIPQNIF